MNKMLISIEENNPGAQVSYITGKSKKVKTVSLEDLIGSLSQNHDVEIGPLPLGVRYFKGGKMDYTIAIEMPPMVDKSKVSMRSNTRSGRSRKTWKLPFPISLFIFRVVGKKVLWTRLCALKRPFFTFEDIAYRFPYGNVYSHFGVCWGGVKKLGLSSINSYNDLTTIINAFYTTGFNGDLTNDPFCYNTTKYGNNFWAFVEEMKNKSAFPADALVATKTTIHQLIKKGNQDG